MDMLSLEEAVEKPADTVVSVTVHIINLNGPQTYKTKTDTERRFFIATVADTTTSCQLRIYKTVPCIKPNASVFIKDAIRKTGDNQLWVVSSTKVSAWAPIEVPQDILAAALNNNTTKPDGPTKLSKAIKMNSSCDIIAKVVQTSPLKYRRNGELPIKILALQDTPNEGPVKIALFGEDAQRDFNEGDVLSVTQTYRWKDTQTLSTKKSTKIEYLPQDSLILQQTGPCFNDDDFSADTTNSLGSEPEEFQIMGITSAHKYQCCPNSECRNKKLENDSCPTCKGKSLTRQTYFSAAQVVLRRSDGSYEMRKIFHTDLKLLCEMPDLNTMEEDPALYQFLTGLLPINARGLFLNGKITIMSTKRQHDR